MAAAAPIVLTTDFGTLDPYVGVMKGVILVINPRASIIDLTHQVQPQNVSQAAFLLGFSWRYFPAGTIHVVVVDPGVGTDRRAVLLETPEACFIAPDNGVLSYVLGDYLSVPPQQAGAVTVPPELRAYHLTNPQYWLQPLSNTFHGRDLFAPVAAHRSLGTPAGSLGTPVFQLFCDPVPLPEPQGRDLLGRVAYVDHFGNLVSNIRAGQVPGDAAVSVAVAGRRIFGLSRTFAEGNPSGGEELLALVGSHGYLEVALRNGNAARALGVGVGEPVLLRREA